MSLADFHERYELIMRDEPSEDRDRNLSSLMDEIKAAFGVPLMQDHEWERENKAVIALYRMVANSRTTI
ncbi:hypothetical protein [Alicyclobacillus fodiniaquatilis]|uniref:Uncharacterized protein n=1 Tax=Alicyclobacillus fodiniaquatilis TaxID=1661150 RepID=A0ABW4JCJ0_9BACL